MLLSAQFLQNPGEPVLDQPAVWILSDTIQWVGPLAQLPPEAKGDPDHYRIEGAIFPGLVNAHCHLELSHLENLPYPGDFVAWIREVLAWKYAPDGEASDRAMARGILQCLLGGTTTIGDHISCDGELEILTHSPLRGRAFVEILGVVPEVAQDLLDCSFALARDFEKAKGRFQIHPTPHSVHALDADVLKKAFAQGTEMFSIHLGESEAEQEYFSEGKGMMMDLIRERGSPLRPRAPSALQVLNQEGVLDEKILAVHGNYFSPEDLDLCAQRGVSIVHCPLSHQYFGHRPFPWHRAVQAGVNIALGTDSLASARSLSMLEVMRAAQADFPDIAPMEIFAAATRGGAKALKMADLVGRVAPGKKADLIGIGVAKNRPPLPALFKAEQVDFSMIGGQILIG